MHFVDTAQCILMEKMIQVETDPGRQRGEVSGDR